MSTGCKQQSLSASQALEEMLSEIDPRGNAGGGQREKKCLRLLFWSCSTLALTLTSLRRLRGNDSLTLLGHCTDVRGMEINDSGTDHLISGRQRGQALSHLRWKMLGTVAVIRNHNWEGVFWESRSNAFFMLG